MIRRAFGNKRVHFNILAELALYQISSLSTHSDSKNHE